MNYKTVIILILALIFAGSANAATLSWNPVTTYTDGTTIPTTKTINYTTFTGTSSTGPWTTDSTVTSASDTVPEPLPGGTLWYTVSAEVDGISSAKAAAISKTAPFKTPSTPGGLAIQ